MLLALSILLGFAVDEEPVAFRWAKGLSTQMGAVVLGEFYATCTAKGISSESIKALQDLSAGGAVFRTNDSQPGVSFLDIRFYAIYSRIVLSEKIPGSVEELRSVGKSSPSRNVLIEHLVGELKCQIVFQDCIERLLNGYYPDFDYRFFNKSGEREVFMQAVKNMLDSSGDKDPDVVLSTMSLIANPT